MECLGLNSIGIAGIITLIVLYAVVAGAVAAMAIRMGSGDPSGTGLIWPMSLPFILSRWVFIKLTAPRTKPVNFNRDEGRY